ncbi:MAG TPA: MlaD family protein [Terricaulis sp.]|nr:MlaD family protein [Terricaulis sp.]
MNFERWGETLLGAAVVIVAVGFFAFAAAQGGQTESGQGGYDLSARFQRVNGIARGSDVRVSGVKVGVVRSVELDPETYEAVLVMRINNGVQVLDDSTASVDSDGLLGGAHVRIEPAGLDPIAAGGTIPNTRGSTDWLTLFASFAQGGNNGGEDNSSQEGAAP